MASVQTENIGAFIPRSKLPQWVIEVWGESGIDVDHPPSPERFSKRDVKEPEWEKFGFRGQVGKLLWERGLETKAIRFLNCNKCARPGHCDLYPNEHKYYVPNGCEVIFCRECAQEVRRELFQAYLKVILAVLISHGCPRGWTLARINFTLWSDGSEITPERVRKMNAAVRSVMWKSVRSRRGYGMLFVDEVGFELRGHGRRKRKAGGLNLHAHGLYFGPYLDWEKTRDLWMRETGKQFPQRSRGFWVKEVKGWRRNPERAVRHALNHMLKYVSKPPAISSERLASLIAAFDGARRVHSLGLFYGEKPKSEKKNCLCPKCKALGIPGIVSFEGRSLPNGGCIPRIVRIEELVAEGYIPLREARRDAVLAMGQDARAAP